MARTSRLLLGLGAAASAALLTARTVGLPGGYSEAGSPEANISLAVQLAFCGLAALRFGQQHRSSRLAWYAPGGRYACWGGAPMDGDRRLVLRAVRGLLGATLAIVLLAPTALAVNIGAAGDIADRPGGNRNHVATANVLGANTVSLVLALGDNQYPCGELEFYQNAYHLSWGRYRAITRPAPGEDVPTAVELRWRPQMISRQHPPCLV